MFTGFIIAIFGHIANAIASLIDKLLLDEGFEHPATYAVTISGLSALALFAWPMIGVETITWDIALRSVLFGACFFGGLWRFFKGLKHTDTGAFVPLTAATVTLSTILLELLHQEIEWSSMDWMHAAGFLTLILSMGLLAYAQHTNKKPIGLSYAIEAGVFFGLASVNAHLMYQSISFVQGFFYSRLSVIVCILLSFLLVPAIRKDLFDQGLKTKRSSVALFFLGQLFGAIGFAGIQYAHSVTLASLINALQAVQFGFLALITGGLHAFLPSTLREQWKGKVGLLKVSSLFLTVIGIVLLA